MAIFIIKKALKYSELKLLNLLLILDETRQVNRMINERNRKKLVQLTTMTRSQVPQI